MVSVQPENIPSNCSRHPTSSECRDHNCSLRKPTRRPSAESLASSCGLMPLPSGVSNSDSDVMLKLEESCSSNNSEDGEATPLTCNQSFNHSCFKRADSANTAETAETAKSSVGLDGCPLPPARSVSPASVSFQRSSRFDEIQSEFEEMTINEEEGNASPNTLSCTPSLSPNMLTEDRIRSFMVDYYEDFNSIFHANAGSDIKTRKECLLAFTEQYFTPDFCFIRSSGNPLDTSGFVTLCAELVEVSSVTLVSIDNIQLLAGGTVAVVVYSADQNYKYKGTPNSDRSTITAVMHSFDHAGQQIRIGHEQRSVGKPIPKATRWESQQ